MAPELSRHETNMLISLITTTKIAAASVLLSSVLVGAFSTPALQSPKPAPGNSTPPGLPAPAANLPSDYLIGVGDVLTVVFWRDKELSGDVVVRPDGKISLPMLNDVSAVGLAPEMLAGVIAKAAAKF